MLKIHLDERSRQQEQLIQGRHEHVELLLLCFSEVSGRQLEDAIMPEIAVRAVELSAALDKAKCEPVGMVVEEPRRAIQKCTTRLDVVLGERCLRGRNGVVGALGQKTLAVW